MAAGRARRPSSSSASWLGLGPGLTLTPTLTLALALALTLTLALTRALSLTQVVEWNKKLFEGVQHYTTMPTPNLSPTPSP